MKRVFKVYTDGNLIYDGESLAAAIGQWVGATWNKGKVVAGGIAVQDFSGDLMVRDGWVVHVHEDGTVYISRDVQFA